jgi:hypothetical protein
MKQSKKAGVGLLVGITFVLACIAVMGSGLYIWTTGARGKVDIESCRLSIISASKSSVLRAGAPVTSMHCPQTELVIKKGDIVENGLINQNKAHKIIADSMAQCWYMVGEGTLDPFSQWDTKGQSYCLVCKKIVFDDALRKYIRDSETNEYLAKKRGTNGFITSPIPYLTNNKYTADKTYWDYLYNTDPRFESEELTKMTKQIIPENSHILVMMHKIEAKSVFWNAVKVTGGVILVAVGGILTATGVGAVIGVPLIYIGAGLTAAAVIGYAILAPIVMDAYSLCPECDAVGGIALIPAGQNLHQKFTAEIQNEKEKIPLCTLLVN